MTNFSAVQLDSSDTENVNTRNAKQRNPQLCHLPGDLMQFLAVY